MRSFDPVGAELLLRVINAFKRASHELLLQGADQLVTPLRAAVEAGRRDPSDGMDAAARSVPLVESAA